MTGRSHCITDKIGKVYLHREFDRHGEFKSIRFSQPQKFEDTGIDSMLQRTEDLVNETLRDERVRRAGE